MKLLSAKIAGYRSIKGALDLKLEPNVTVVMGANDHGKSNILSALRHLNPDMPFSKEEDLSWDLSDKDVDFPEITGDFVLDEDEHQELLKQYTTQTSANAPSGSSLEVLERVIKSLTVAIDTKSPIQVKVSRRGVKSALEITTSSLIPVDLIKPFVLENLPRFEIIPTWSKIGDEVTAAELKTNDFMRGIFYYAGINPNDCASIFSQDDASEMELQKASERLTIALQKQWSQGQNLKFKLSHDSKKAAIALKIVDPTVTSRLVRPSKRSVGFTHYFTLKSVLHGRQNDHIANSYILLFDEPGIYLHPKGQHDLLQVMEALGMSNQIVYVTHSLFMINKNFPYRHRLIHKGSKGTVVDSKPYVNQWARALSIIGWSTTGTILFANSVVLTEGDSDPVYLQSSWQYYASRGVFSGDLNEVAFISTCDSKNAEFILQELGESNIKPKALCLFDGDQGGVTRARQIKETAERFGCGIRTLDEGSVIEELVPYSNDLIPKALADVICSMLSKKKLDSNEVSDHCKKTFDCRKDTGTKKVTVTSWMGSCAEHFGLDRGVSKVAVAKRYGELLLARSPADCEITGPMLDLLKEIRGKLSVPEVARVEDKVFDT